MRTKEKIIDKALELFSQYGFELVSMDDIAKGVGIKAPSLYKHFSSKQAIYDEILNQLNVNRKVNLLQVNFDNIIDVISKEYLTELVITSFKNSFENKTLNQFRKLMTIEQYRNNSISKNLTKISYLDLVEYYKDLFTLLMENGKMKQDNAELVALEFVSTVSMLIALCDRDDSYMDYALKLIEQHVHKFYDFFF